MTTWDPNEDFNQTAAELRAADMMTDELADEIVAPPRPNTGTEWLEAAQAQATSEPTVEVNQGTESEVRPSHRHLDMDRPRRPDHIDKR